MTKQQLYEALKLACVKLSEYSACPFADSGERITDCDVNCGEEVNGEVFNYENCWVTYFTSKVDKPFRLEGEIILSKPYSIVFEHYPCDIEEAE